MARGRPPKLPESITGFTLEMWLADPSNIRWAAQEPMFHRFIAVLTNERWRARDADAPRSENYLAGATDGYEKALLVANLAATGVRQRAVTDEEATYPGDNL